MATIVLSNFINDKFVDRIYQNFNKSYYLVLKNGSLYSGKIKQIKKNNKRYFLTQNNKWFNCIGLPIEKPDFFNTQEELKTFKDEIKKDEENKKFENLKKKISNS